MTHVGRIAEFATLAASKDVPDVRALLIVDNSEASKRAIQYSTSILSSCRYVSLYLAYVLPPLPPELLEFGGSENPEKEDQLQTRLHQDQEQWFAAARGKAQPLVEQTRRSLANGTTTAEFEIEYIEPETGLGIADELLDVAKQRRCSTIVVGHEAHSWFRGLVGRDLVEDLLRRGKGIAIWVVE